jgi:hypothetical protein
MNLKRLALTVAGASVFPVRTRLQKWMPFPRGGYAKDGGSLLQKSLSVGHGELSVDPGYSVRAQPRS